MSGKNYYINILKMDVAHNVILDDTSLYYIILALPYYETIKFFQTNLKFGKLCSSDLFWRQKALENYGTEIPLKNAAQHYFNLFDRIHYDLNGDVIVDQLVSDLLDRARFLESSVQSPPKLYFPKLRRVIGDEFLRQNSESKFAVLAKSEEAAAIMICFLEVFIRDDESIILYPFEFYNSTPTLTDIIDYLKWNKYALNKAYDIAPVVRRDITNGEYADADQIYPDDLRIIEIQNIDIWTLSRVISIIPLLNFDF